MSKATWVLIILGIAAFIAAMVIGVDTLMCTPPCI